MSQQKRAHTDAGAETEPVPKEQKLKVQEIEDSDESDDDHLLNELVKRLTDVQEPHVLLQVAFVGVKSVGMRWGDGSTYVRVKRVLECPTVGPAVRKEMARHASRAAGQASFTHIRDKVWKLRFATKESGFPLEEDSRTILDLQIDDNALVEAICRLTTSVPTNNKFCGSIVGHINLKATL